MTHEQRLVELVSAHGIANAGDCVTASQQPGRPTLPRCLAMLENESGGRNVFGADPGGSALPRGWFDTEVTHAKYLVYKFRRDRLGLTPNGVGPCQLTSVGLQKEAEQLGGCWKPLHNMQVGFHFLHGLILEHGVFGGFESYNGSGAAAVSYAERAMSRAAVWEGRLKQAGLA
jgi:hypothetical protein